MAEPLWISEEVVRAIHEDQIKQHGGSLGIRDENLLAASLARPRHWFTYSSFRCYVGHLDPPKSPLKRGTFLFPPF